MLYHNVIQDSPIEQEIREVLGTLKEDYQTKRPVVEVGGHVNV